MKLREETIKQIIDLTNKNVPIREIANITGASFHSVQKYGAPARVSREKKIDAPPKFNRQWDALRKTILHQPLDIYEKWALLNMKYGKEPRKH